MSTEFQVDYSIDQMSDRDWLRSIDEPVDDDGEEEQQDVAGKKVGVAWGWARG